MANKLDKNVIIGNIVSEMTELEEPVTPKATDKVKRTPAKTQTKSKDLFKKNREMKTIRTSILLKQSIADALEQCAKDNKTSKNDVVDLILSDYLKSMGYIK